MTSPPTSKGMGAVLWALVAFIIAAVVAAILVFGR